MQTIVNFQDVGMAYHTLQGEIPALSNITFSIKEGEFVSIVGPSGCGKSTVLNLLAGLLFPEKGTITIQGVPIEHSNIPVGYMLQKDHLFEWCTVYQNVILGLEIQHKKTPENLARVENLLKKYGLEDFKHAKPSQLSGGMRQRAALIRTLALNPQLLLLDEPFSALDYQTRLQVSDDIWKIIREENKTALLVTHDISEAVSMSNRVLIFSKGPAVIQKELPIEVSMDTKSPMAVRNAPEFKTYFNQIWKELNPHESE